VLIYKSIWEKFPFWGVAFTIAKYPPKIPSYGLLLKNQKLSQVGAAWSPPCDFLK